MLKKMSVIAIVAATALTGVTGCANKDMFSGDVYSGNRAQRIQTVSFGTITSARPVRIQADEESVLGTIGGAVIGGLLGNTIGGGTGRNLATAGGAIAGAAAGRAVADRTNQVDAVELEIRRETGETIVVVQRANPALVPGARVRLTHSNNKVNVSLAN